MAHATRPAEETKLRKLHEYARRAQAILALRADPRPWIEQNLCIRTKDQQLLPLALNAVQADYYHRRGSRDLILKPRQLGFTTLVCALFFGDAVLHPNTVSAIVAHDADSSRRIFAIVRLYWERLPQAEKHRIGKPQILNRQEMYWPKLNSRFYVGTAGAFTFGRGQTITNLHCSEFAFWPRPAEALVALTEAVPSQGRIVIESTAHGMGNALHDLWVAAKAGENGYTSHFYRWWQDPNYQLEDPDPLGVLAEDEQQLRESYGLSEEQIRWRRAKRRELGDSFAQEYPEDDVTCFLASGRCCFDVTALMAAQQRIAGEPEPELLAQLQDEAGNAVPVSPARLSIWRHPEPDHTYVIGADVGEGLAHGDASAACVIDRESGEQVAELHGRVSPERFARLLDALGRHYHQAELAVERNNHGHSVLNTLFHATSYPDLYYHTDYDQAGQHRRELGWPTDQKTKPIMVDDFTAAVAGGHLLIHSSGLVDECFSFVVTDTGSQEAQPGKHDDRVVAAGIAWQVRKRPVPWVGGFQV
jgi:hypothetical protein